VERALRWRLVVRTKLLLVGPVRLLALLFLLFPVLFAVGPGCASGAATGFADEDAGAVADAPSADAPPVVFPPDDPLAAGGDDGGAPDDAALLIVTPATGDDASVAPAGPSFDAGPDGECGEPLGPGDLAIDELLIASLSGTGDHGEWLEVVSTRSCALDLVGLHAECPVGAKVITLDVTTDVWIPAGGFFVIADSTDPAVNHALPGLVLGWAGSPGDVLRNEGGTVTLIANGALVDSVTYPDIKKLSVGTSIAFPGDCAMPSRSNWALWQPSQSSWFPEFFGTPNALNEDVRCPDD
jgi:hypothetical protein